MVKVAARWAGILALVALPAGMAWAQDLDAPDLAGTWTCVAGCNPAYAPTKVEQKGNNFVFHNERTPEGVSRGTYINAGPTAGTIRADDWGMTATISGDRKTIKWSTGAVWQR